MRTGALVLSILILGFFNRAAADSCDQLDLFISKNKITSVDSLLSEMSKSSEWTDFLKRYTFVFKSKSLQHATSEEPRALVYSSDGQMIMSFIGHAESDGRDAVEVICWRQEKKAFELFDLDFSSGRQPDLRAASANPSRCLSCHGSDPRPNFEAYNTWSGFYGSLSRNGCSFMTQGLPEYEGYRAFMRGNRRSGRYGFLPEELKDSEANGIYGSGCLPMLGSPVANFRNSVSTEPNAEILDLLTPLNNQRIARIIAQRPQARLFLPALRAIRGYQATVEPESAGTCRDIEAYLPASSKDGRVDTNAIRAEIARTATEEFEFRRKGFYLFNADFTHPDLGKIQPLNFLLDGERSLRRLTAFQYLLNRMGLSFSRFTMGFDSGTYDLISNRYSLDKSLDAIVDSIIAELGEPVVPLPTRGTCNETVQASLASLKNYVPPVIPAEKLVVNPTPVSEVDQSRLFKVLNSTCLQCHGVSQKDLPFHSPTELRTALTGSTELKVRLQERIVGINLRGKSQMPLGAPFEPKLQLELLNYLESLSRL